MGQYGAGFTEAMLSAMSDPGCMTVRGAVPIPILVSSEKALEEQV